MKHRIKKPSAHLGTFDYPSLKASTSQAIVPEFGQLLNTAEFKQIED